MLNHQEAERIHAMSPKAVSSQETVDVLLIEDDYALREVAKAMLESMGYAVGTARNGAEARECVRHRPYDIVISDLQMPGTDGFALANWLRLRLEPVRIILMTGLHPAEVSSHTAAHLADGWLFKPFSRKDMKNVLQNVLIRHPQFLTVSQ